MEHILSHRKDDLYPWVPSWLGSFGCADMPAKIEYHSRARSRKSAPFLILKGLGTMTLGRIGERSNNLRDDIMTWKQRIEDSLFIGWITYSTRSSSSSSGDFPDLQDDVDLASTEGKKLALIIIEDVIERSVYDIESGMMEENSANQYLLQLLRVLEVSLYE